MMINTLKTSKLLFSLFIMLGLFSISFYSRADGCVNTGGVKHATMTATAGTVNLSGSVKQNQEIGRYTFVRDGQNNPVAECQPNSEVYGYTTHSEALSIYPTYYMDINGQPAYYFYGIKDFAYVLIDNKTGLAFRSQPGQALPVEGDRLYPVDATVIVYAAKDNPDSINFRGQHIGSVLITRYSSGGGTTSVGFSYKLAIQVINAPTSCSAENTNLEMNLPKMPITAFSDIGFPRDNQYTEDDLRINCTGDASAKIKLMAHNTTSYEGQKTIIKPDNEGNSDNAKGVGFVVSSPSSGDTVLINNQFVKLADLASGINNVPLKAEYYRYGDEIKPGKLSASANFVLEFN